MFKWAKYLNRHISINDMQIEVANENIVNIISHQEMQITTTKRYHFTPTKMTITKKIFFNEKSELAKMYSR